MAERKLCLCVGLYNSLRADHLKASKTNSGILKCSQHEVTRLRVRLYLAQRCFELNADVSKPSHEGLNLIYSMISY